MNMLKDSAKVSDITNRNTFHPYVPKCDEKK